MISASSIFFSQEISKLNEDKLKWQKNIKDYTENISKYIDELNDLLLNLSKDNIDVSMMENMIEKYNSLISTLNIEDLMSNDSNNKPFSSSIYFEIFSV
jgi:hypothetical protein